MDTSGLDKKKTKKYKKRLDKCMHLFVYYSVSNDKKINK